MKRFRPQPQPDRLTKGPSRGTYQNDVKVQFINAVLAAMKANPAKVSVASIGCLPPRVQNYQIYYQFLVE
jgi:hypothetical protein